MQIVIKGDKIMASVTSRIRVVKQDRCYEDSGFITKCKWDFCPNCGAKMVELPEDKNKKCEDCTEWEYFEGYGYGCFCMKTMTPIDADKCEFYDKRHDVPHSWKPLKVEPQESEE